MTADPASPSTRRFDPERRERIIDACLHVLARDGVAGTSHRRVAAEADVPLGSMTYHFAGMDELLTVAFDRFVDGAAADLDRRMEHATTPEQAQAAVVTAIDQDLIGARDLVITHELYTLAARRPAYRAITERWMTRRRHALQRHFDPITARILDAMIEGLTLHRALDTRRGEADVTTSAIERVIR